MPNPESVISEWTDLPVVNKCEWGVQPSSPLLTHATVILHGHHTAMKYKEQRPGQQATNSETQLPGRVLNEPMVGKSLESAAHMAKLC